MLHYNHGEKLRTPEEGILDLRRAIGKLPANLLDVSSHNLSTPINRDFVESFEGGFEVMAPRRWPRPVAVGPWFLSSRAKRVEGENARIGS